MIEKKKLGILIGIIISLIILVIGGSFAYFVANVGGKGNEEGNTTNVTTISLGEIKYEGVLTFQGENIYPGYKNIQTFTISPDTKQGKGTYEINLEGTISEVFGRDVRITLYKTENKTTNNITRTEGTLKQSGNTFIKEDELVINGNLEKVYEGVLTNSKITLEQNTFEVPGIKETTYYLVYDYVDNQNQDKQQGQTFQGKITVKYILNKNYQEELLNGTDPVITGSLIPITLESDGTVRKADQSKEWYNYQNQQWANAVILKEETTTYQNNEVIPESNIESYFVWIPRYKYKIFNEGLYTTRTEIDTSKVQTIEVVFENKNTSVSTGSTLGTWLTHPAFTSFGSNGMWVGKFETGKSSGRDNVIAPEQIQIKPNIKSWRSIQIANAFYTSYDYKRELDSHMMKNTEWGAVAYLQHSLYGSRQSVRINNNSSYITGYSANNEPTCGYTATNEECNRYCSDGTCNKPYNTETGYLASTTANISGIYDMSGGAWEYVMGVLLDQSGNPMSGRNNMYNSGFNGTLGCPTCDSDTSGITQITNGQSWPDRKYYDTYAYSTSDQQYQRRILGDATGEMGPFGTATYLTTRAIGSWYADYAYFVFSSFPWFRRGGYLENGSDAGVFAFSNDYGRALGNISFRLVLTP